MILAKCWVGLSGLVGGRRADARLHARRHRDLDLSRRSPPRAKADHPRLAEGTAEEVLDQALHSFLIARLEPHTLVHAEARVSRTDPLTTGGPCPGNGRTPIMCQYQELTP